MAGFFKILFKKNYWMKPISLSVYSQVTYVMILHTISFVKKVYIVENLFLIYGK